MNCEGLSRHSDLVSFLWSAVQQRPDERPAAELKDHESVWIQSNSDLDPLMKPKKRAAGNQPVAS